MGDGRWSVMGTFLTTTNHVLRPQNWWDLGSLS